MSFQRSKWPLIIIRLPIGYREPWRRGATWRYTENTKQNDYISEEAEQDKGWLVAQSNRLGRPSVCALSKLSIKYDGTDLKLQSDNKRKSAKARTARPLQCISYPGGMAVRWYVLRFGYESSTYDFLATSFCLGRLVPSRSPMGILIGMDSPDAFSS